LKRKYSKIVGVLLALMLLASLFGFAAAPVSARNADWDDTPNPDDENEEINISYSDVGAIAVTPDGGTIFAAIDTTQSAKGVISDHRRTFSLPDAGDQVTFTGKDDDDELDAEGTWTTNLAVGFDGTGPVDAEITFSLPDAGDQVTFTGVAGFGKSVEGTWEADETVDMTGDEGTFSGTTYTFDIGRNDEIILTVPGGGGPVTGTVTFTSEGMLGEIIVGAPDATVTRTPTTTFTFDIEDDETIILTALVANTTGTLALTKGGMDAAITFDADVPDDATVTAPGVHTLVQTFDLGIHYFKITGYANEVDAVTGIAISPNFETDGTMYLAAGATVYRSVDKGVTFTELNPIPGDPLRVNSIAMWPGTPAFVMVGTDDSVFVLRDSLFETWSDQGLGAEALAVAFAPDFATSNYIWAVRVDGIVSSTNSLGAWGSILADTPVLVAAANASIAFPSDGYNSATAPNLWVGVNSTANIGGVWRIRGLPSASYSESLATKQYGTIGAEDANDVLSLDASGSLAAATLIIGLNDEVTVVKSINGGVTWATTIHKQPTGARGLQVLMAPDFATSNEVYAATSGADSAFQVSRDGGITWNQTAIIDTEFKTINDIAVIDSGTLFVVSGSDSLWKVDDVRTRDPIWERVLTADIAGFTTLDRVEVSPDFATDGIVYAFGATGVVASLTKSNDGGNLFTAMSAPAELITALHVVDATFIFAGAAADVYWTDDGGFSWLRSTNPPLGSIVSIDTAPNYAESGIMIAGTSLGDIYRSLDRGKTWAIEKSDKLAASVNNYVAFDPAYLGQFGPPINRTIYAGGEDIIQVYQQAWRTIDTTIPEGSEITGLVVSSNGTVYAANYLDDKGLQRSLNPLAQSTNLVEGSSTPIFETTGLRSSFSGEMRKGLWLIEDPLRGNVIFSIPYFGGKDRVAYYIDTLDKPVETADVGDVRVDEVRLNWSTLTGAAYYAWQIARDPEFRTGVEDGTSFYPTYLLTNNEPANLQAGKTYYWRIRVDGDPGSAPLAEADTEWGAPVLSRWSEAKSFTTGLGARAWNPFQPIAGVGPAPGAQDIITKPALQWNGADWATSYELMLADNPDFTGATAKTLTSTSWVSDTDLGYSTTWYWKVRGVSDASTSEWSDVGVFTTMAAPVAPAPPVTIQEVPDIIVEVPPITVPPAVEVTPTPTWALLAIIIVGAVLLIGVFILIIRTRRPI